MGRIVDHWRTDGYALWAVERVADGSVPRVLRPVRPGLGAGATPEIGWRLARHAWGHGYATEAAREVVRFAFEDLGLEALVSYTTIANARSRRVMEKLGMARSDPAAAFDFLHPRSRPTIRCGRTSPTGCHGRRGWHHA